MERKIPFVVAQEKEGDQEDMGDGTWEPCGSPKGVEDEEWEPCGSQEGEERMGFAHYWAQTLPYGIGLDCNGSNPL